MIVQEHLGNRAQLLERQGHAPIITFRATRGAGRPGLLALPGAGPVPARRPGRAC
jgi:hypothetical protein